MRLATRAWWLLVGMVTGSVFFAVFVGWLAARHLLLSEFDAVLGRRAERYALAARTLVGTTIPEPASQTGTWFVRVVDGHGQVVYSSRGPWPEGLESALPTSDGIVTRRTVGDAVFRVLRIADAHFAVRDAQDPAVDGYVIAAMDASELHRNLTRLLLLLSVVMALAVISAILVAGVMRDGILAPVNRLGAAIDQLPPDDLGARLCVGTMPAELRHVAERVDLLLQRLGTVRARERRTVADLAHELRTPLAAMRSELEFASRSGDFSAARFALFADQVSALQQRTDRLLLVSRLEAGTQPVSWQSVSFADLVSDAWAVQAPSDGTRKSYLDLDDAGDAVIPGDSTLLAILVRNLVSNAMAHGSDGSLSVSIRQAEEQTVWSFANRVDGQLPGDRNQAFEPFWRQDRSRSGADRHSGLGLAVVQRIVEAHGAQISAAVVDDRFIVTVRWPREAPTS